jgi:hypothetical protein
MRSVILAVQVSVPDGEDDERVTGIADNALDTEHVVLPEDWTIVGHVSVVPEKLSDADWNRAVGHHRDQHVYGGRREAGPIRLCPHQECRTAYRAYTWGAMLDCCKVWRVPA